MNKIRRPHNNQTSKRVARTHASPWLRNYFSGHAQEALSSLGKLWRAPFATLLTILVIGIALALPTGLGLGLQQTQALSQGWDGNPQISLFLKKTLGTKEIEKIQQRMRAHKAIETVEWIPAEQALQNFKTTSGFGDLLNDLTENPLPDVLILRPKTEQSTPAQLESLVNELAKSPEVDIAQLDFAWVKKLNAIINTMKRAALVVALLLAMAVLLTVGNSIRLEVQNRRDEIEVSKLIGATHAFIRRPFLYTGLWMGLLGGLIALALVLASLLFLQTPVQALAELYQSNFRLEFPGLLESTSLLIASALLGLLGAWLTVGYHLRQIKPQ